MQNETTFASENVWKAIAKLAVPAVFMTLVITVYNMADVIFIAQTGDAAQIAAVSLASPVFMLQMMLGTLIGGGACAAIANALGSGDKAAVRSASGGASFLTLTMSAAVAAAVMLFPKPIASFLGADASTLGFTARYLFWIGLGTPVTVFSTAFANVVRSEGAMLSALGANMAGTVVNIVLDPIFISGLRMGVTGAAVATVLGNALSSALLILYFVRRPTAATLSPAAGMKDIRMLGKILVLGFSGAVTQLLAGLSNILTNHVWILYGAGVIAASNIAGKASLFASMAIMGVAVGIQPMISYNYGAGNTARLWEILKKSAVLMVALGSALTAAAFLFRAPLLSLFTDDAELVPLALHILPIGILATPLVGLNYLALYWMQAAEKPLVAMLLSVARQGLLLIPIFFLFHTFFGLEGLFWAAPVADLGAVLLSAAFLLRESRRFRGAVVPLPVGRDSEKTVA